MVSWLEYIDERSDLLFWVRGVSSIGIFDCIFFCLCIKELDWFFSFIFLILCFRNVLKVVSGCLWCRKCLSLSLVF